MVQGLAGFNSYSGIHFSLKRSEGWGQVLTLSKISQEGAPKVRLNS